MRLNCPPAGTDKIPKFEIAPTSAVAKLNPVGAPTNSSQLASPTASNLLPPPKPIPVAVVAVKSAGTLRVALGPKIIPAGFIRKRLALPPETWSKPLIIEASPPRIRPRIFSSSGLARNVALCPSSILKRSKLWNKFSPSEETRPPSIVNSSAEGVTVVPVPSAAGVMGWARVPRLAKTPGTTPEKTTVKGSHSHRSTVRDPDFMASKRGRRALKTKHSERCGRSTVLVKIYDSSGDRGFGCLAARMYFIAVFS